MTKQKTLKARIRARMDKTGEHYTVARRHVLANAPAMPSKGPARFHLPGNVPASTALRVLLSAGQGEKTPAMSEALLFGIAGGIGAGVFSFRYEQEDFSTFYVAGRHLWHDDLAYLNATCGRLGVDVESFETGGAKTAATQLRTALAGQGATDASAANVRQPVIAWVDRAHLPRHADPGHQVGEQYHLVTVYEATPDEVCIGDLADRPERVSAEAFAQARARIKKQKNRLLRLTAVPGELPVESAVFDGLRAGCAALEGKGPATPGGKNMAGNFTLDAVARWGRHLHGGTGKQSWAKMFRRGPNLWRGLRSIYTFIHYGSGGGLMRPLFAECLSEVHAQFGGASALQAVAERYAHLGEDWDALAEAALPDEVALFRQYKSLMVERVEVSMSGEADLGRRDAINAKLQELEATIGEAFPLSETACDDLRADLKTRVEGIHRAELDALASLSAAVDARS